MKNHYEFVCAFCGQKKFRHNRQNPLYKLRDTVQFCDRKCRAALKSQEGNVTSKCGWCGKEIARVKSEFASSKRGKIYCNSSCAASFNNTQKRKSRRSKCEEMLFQLIKEHFVDLEVIANDKKMLEGLEIDIAIPSLNFGIEWNGIVHFQPIYGQEKLNRIQELDAKKLLLAQEKGIKLVIVPDLVSSEKYVKEAFREIRLEIESIIAL